jgi:hypothetical protein
MEPTLSIGDKIHIGNSVTLTVLAIEEDMVHFGVETSEPDGDSPSDLVEKVEVNRPSTGQTK